MHRKHYIGWAGLFLFLFATTLPAQELYFVDAHSQFDEEVEASLIIERMNEGGVYKTILASRRHRRPRDAAEAARQYPERIVASVRTKGGPYAKDSKKYYRQLSKQVESGRFHAIAELLVFHAEKAGKAAEVRVPLTDSRVTTALDYAKQKGWPLVIHIEFASLQGSDRDEHMQMLKKFLNDNEDHPMAMIHMGQLPAEDTAALIRAHKNIYFLTSHADPISAVDAKQPWINMMAGNKFTAQWKQLITQHPDRFVFAMDNVWAFQWEDKYMEHIKVWRSALAALPQEVAHAVAHGNAEKLWRLTAK